MEYKGELKGFPDEVVTLMVKRQSDQGNKPDFKVFEYKRGMPKSFGGFNWEETPEGSYFWSSVIHCYNFHTFFEKYPKKSYPKVMMVSDAPIDSNNKGMKRVVFMEKNSKFIAWMAETIEEAERTTVVIAWNYAKDIDEIHDETVVELTIEDISKGKGVGVSPQFIRIKQ